MSALAKVLIAALAATSVQAIPQSYGQYQASTTGAPYPTGTGTGSPAPPAPPSQAPMLGEITAIARFKLLLTEAGQKLKSLEELAKIVVFDFNGATPAAGSLGGATKAANLDTFPILTDLGISTTLGFLAPCGMNTPHVHPRATEFLTVVEGGCVKFGYILENGLVAAGENAEVAGSLDKFQGTVFPQGSIHYQFNDNCAPSVFVATLNSEDPGTSQIAQNFFGLNPDIVNATLGFPKQIDGSNIAQFRKSIPPNLAQGIDTCLARCNIKIQDFPLSSK